MCGLPPRFREPHIPSTADTTLLVDKARRLVANISRGVAQRYNWLYRRSIFSDFDERQAREFQGRIANTRAGKPEPPFGFGKLTTTIAPDSGT
jgi:hypothetical protein